MKADAQRARAQGQARPWSSRRPSQPSERERTPTPVTRPGSAAPWTSSPDPSTPRLGSPLLYGAVGVYSGVPPDLVLPADGRQSGALRLQEGVFRSLRPDSARFGQKVPKEEFDRPSTAPATREAKKHFTREGPHHPQAGKEDRVDDRPQTAPVTGSKHRLSRRSESEEAILEFEGFLEGDEEQDGVTTFSPAERYVQHLHEQDQAMEQDMTEERNIREQAVSMALRTTAFNAMASSQMAVTLRRVPWRPEVFLALKKQADDPMLRTLLQRLVYSSTRKAIAQQSYFVYSDSPAKDDVGETVSLWPQIGHCDVRWYGETATRVSFEMKPSVKEASPDAVVSSHSVLDTIIHLKTVCPEHPTVLIAEVVDFDISGDVDQRNACSIVPDDLLLRSDVGRFLDHIKRSCRQFNQKDNQPNTQLRDYMTDQATPFVARFNEVTVFRGPAEKGYPFLKETIQVTVLLMAMPRQRATLQQVHYQTKPSVDWYGHLSEYQCVVSRFFLLARAIEDLTKKGVEEKKAVVVMPMPGCASNVQQPHDAVANCLKHWKHNYSQMFECLHVCCRNRRGPDHVLTARVRAAVNLRERPAPGLDAHHRHGNTRQPKRIVQDRAILDDPLDEDQTDEAVATFREMSERAVEFGTSRRGSISWTSKTISDFMRKRKDLQEIKKEESPPNRARSQALAMATLSMMKNTDHQADAFGYIKDEESEEEQEEGGAISEDNILRKSHSEKPERRGSAPDLSKHRDIIKGLDNQERRRMRRASTTCVRWEKENPDLALRMPEKVREMHAMCQLAQQSIQAKAAGKVILDTKQAVVKNLDRRRRSSLTGQLGGGEDFQLASDPPSPTSVREVGLKAESLGPSVRPSASTRSLKHSFVTNESLQMRSATRSRLLSRVKDRKDQKDQNQISRAQFGSSRRFPRSAALLKRAQRQAGLLKVAAGAANQEVPSGMHMRPGRRAAFNLDSGERFVLPVPPDRPLASMHTQFRRRNMRENIMIFRARCEDDLTQQDLLDVELATAECEGEILRLCRKAEKLSPKKSY
ncbi:unnamed protein product [Durusdinium trenchii]|uniref:Uncharacterized protein n=1 Tax=Durusdinium trenchii TaxID=1381693 RepID=A0ABP0IUL2_9DINO